MTALPSLSVLDRYRCLIDDWPTFSEAIAQPLPGSVWANPLRIEPQRFAALLTAEGLAVEPMPWTAVGFRLRGPGTIGNRWWYMAGLGHSQEEASLLPVALLDPQPGERILDLCAAPGGKTAQIAVALENRGTVVANDVVIGRMRPLQGNIDRLGLINTSTTRFDGASYPAAAGGFDRILVDAPCSCEGTLRKTLKQPSFPGPGGYLRFQRVQIALLRRAVALCRPGGRIVYSTCTFAPEENELVIDALLEECQGDVQIAPLTIPGFVTAPGITDWKQRTLHPSLADTLRVWPHLNDTGGFYLAALEKVGPSSGPAVPDATVEAQPGPEIETALLNRFALAPELLQDRVVSRRNSRGLCISPRDHAPPAYPQPEGMGMLAVKTKAKPTKPTTAAALWLGQHARQNVIELDAAQRQAYFARASFAVEASQAAQCTSSGYVIVRYAGFPLGVAVYHGGTHTVTSLFPKRWAGVAAAQESEDAV